MMKKTLLLSALALLLCSCAMTTQEAVSKKYPATSGIPIFTNAREVPQKYTVFGTCQTSGNYNDVSRDAMYDKIVSRAEAAGADAVLILGMQIVPAGTRVAANEMVRTLETTSPSVANSWGEIQRDFDGGYSSINNPRYGTAVTYDRVIRAEFLHYDRDENGALLPPDKTAAPVPLKSMKTLQKEAEVAGKPESPAAAEAAK